MNLFNLRNDAAKSNFSYKLEIINGSNVLAITDNGNALSVTNNIEAIVKYISERESLDLTRYIILYNDSEGFWDGWDYKNEDFIILRDLGSLELAFNKFWERSYL